MTLTGLLKRPTAILPFVLSSTALALVVGFVTVVGVVQPEDEGPAARIFQLLMVAQLAIMGIFAVRWIPEAPRPAGLILVLQLAAAAVPIALIFWLER